MHEIQLVGFTAPIAPHHTIERTPSSKSEPFVFIEIESVEIEYIGPKMAMVVGRHQQRKLASDLDPEVALDRARN